MSTGLKPYRSGLYTSFIVEHEMGRGFSARERLTSGPFTTPFEGWDDESLLRQSTSSVSPAILQKLALSPSSSAAATATAAGGSQQNSNDNNNAASLIKERLSRIATRSSTGASLKRRVEPFDEPICGMRNGQPIIGNSNGNFDAFVKERLEQKAQLEEQLRRAPPPDIDPALRLAQEEMDEQEFEWMKVIKTASKETRRKIQQSLVVADDEEESVGEAEEQANSDDNDSEYMPQADDEESNQRRQRMEIVANDLDPSADGSLLVNFAESVANSVRRTRPMELPMKRAFFNALKEKTRTSNTTTPEPEGGDDEGEDEDTTGSYSEHEDNDVEFLLSKRPKSKGKSKSKAGSGQPTTTTTATTTANSPGVSKHQIGLQEKKRLLKVEEQLSKMEEKRLRLEKKLQQQEEKRLKDERQRQEIEERIKKDEIQKQRLKERNKKEMEIENEDDLESSDSSDEDESRKDQGDDTSAANNAKSDDGTKSEYSSVSNNKKSKKKKKRQKDDDPGPQFFELGRLGRKGRARKLTPLEIEVHEFLLERYADVRKAFVDQFPHIPEEDRLMCPKTKTGVPIVAPEDRYRYPMLNRNGIGGVVSKKPGTQKFQVVFHNVAFSGAKLQLNAKFTSFEDPRDCAAVLAKLDEYFKEFRRSRLPKYLLKKVQERQQSEQAQLQGNGDAKSGDEEAGDGEAGPTTTTTTTTTATTATSENGQEQQGGENGSTTIEE